MSDVTITVDPAPISVGVSVSQPLQTTVSVVTGGSGGGNPFNQSLNTSDAVAFGTDFHIDSSANVETTGYSYAYGGLYTDNSGLNTDGSIYGLNNLFNVDTAGNVEANSVTLPGGLCITDAPNDGLTYVRQSGAWAIIGKPTNTVAPALSPSNETSTGVELSVSNGTWTGSPTSYSYQWQVSTDATNFTNIDGQTSATFTPYETYNLKYVRAGVIANNLFGPSSVAYSDATGELLVPAYPLGAIAAYHLNNDGSGNVSLVDSTGNGNDLTNNNGVTLGTGILDGDAVFNPSNLNSLTATISTISAGNAFSFSLWYKQISTDSDGSFPMVIDFSGRNVCLVANYGNEDTAGYVAGSLTDNWFLSDLVDFRDGLWHHCIFVFDGSNSSFYFDGNLLGTISIQDGTVEINNISLGRGLGPTSTCNGEIDETVIWPRALSSAEVVQLYNGGSGLPYPA